MHCVHPLTPVLIVASAMERSPDLPSGLQQAFAMIRKNVKLEARLIDDLLDIGIAQGKLRCDFTAVDPRPVIEESIEGLRADINEKQLRVVLDLSAPEHHVRADPARLRQIFGNLFSNATSSHLRRARLRFVLTTSVEICI